MTYRDWVKAFGQGNWKPPAIFVAIIRIYCKNFAITVYFLFVSFLNYAFNCSSKRKDDKVCEVCSWTIEINQQINHQYFMFRLPSSRWCDNLAYTCCSLCITMWLLWYAFIHVTLKACTDATIYTKRIQMRYIGLGPYIYSGVHIFLAKLPLWRRSLSQRHALRIRLRYALFTITNRFVVLLNISLKSLDRRREKHQQSFK